MSVKGQSAAEPVYLHISAGRHKRSREPTDCQMKREKATVVLCTRSRKEKCLQKSWRLRAIRETDKAGDVVAER